MKKLILLLLAQALVSCIMAQTARGTTKQINLTQKQSANDVQIVHGKYTFWFRAADLVDAIAKIDKETKKDHSAFSRELKEGKIKYVRWDDDTSTNRKFTNFFENELGCYLFSRAKVVITKDNKPLKVIRQLVSPELQLPNGTTEVSMAYVDGNVQVFGGRINTRLRPPQ